MENIWGHYKDYNKYINSPKDNLKKFLQIMKESNINNQKLTNLILQQMKTGEYSDLFSGVINNTNFRKIIAKTYIFNDYQTLFQNLTTTQTDLRIRYIKETLSLMEYDQELIYFIDESNPRKIQESRLHKNFRRIIQAAYAEYKHHPLTKL